MFPRTDQAPEVCSTTTSSIAPSSRPHMGTEDLSVTIQVPPSSDLYLTLFTLLHGLTIWQSTSWLYSWSGPDHQLLAWHGTAFDCVPCRNISSPGVVKSQGPKDEEWQPNMTCSGVCLVLKISGCSLDLHPPSQCRHIGVWGIPIPRVEHFLPLSRRVAARLKLRQEGLVSDHWPLLSNRAFSLAFTFWRRNRTWGWSSYPQTRCSKPRRLISPGDHDLTPGANSPQGDARHRMPWSMPLPSPISGLDIDIFKSAQTFGRATPFLSFSNSYICAGLSPSFRCLCLFQWLFCSRNTIRTWSNAFQIQDGPVGH